VTTQLEAKWPIVPTEQIAAPEKGSIVSGPFGSAISSKYFEPLGTPVIRGNNLTLGVTSFVDEGFVFLGPEKTHQFRNMIARAGDIVFTAAGTLGQVGIIPSRSRFPAYIISNKQLRLRVDKTKIDPKFAYYWYSSPLIRQKIVASNRGSSVPLITLQVLRALPITLPPLDEQTRIASILCAYDDLIENNTRRIAILEEMARRIFEEWFVHFRASGCEGLPLVDSALGPVPRGWRVKPLREFGVVNPEQISPRSPPAEISYIDIASVSPGSVDAVTKLPFSNAPNRARRIVRHGDTIWSCVRPNRRSFALVLQPTENTVVSTGFAVLRATDVPWSYLYMVVTTQTFTDYLTNHATGSAYPAVKAGDFEKAELLAPPRPVLDRFAMVIEPPLSLSHNLRLQIANLRAQRDLLLPKLISGEMNVRAASGPLQEAAE
jgi:type I restriction enzyme, S subunit